MSSNYGNHAWSYIPLPHIDQNRTKEDVEKSLEPGEMICDKCDGIGDIESSEYIKTVDTKKVEKYRVICPKCHGHGKLDWVENALGGKRNYTGVSGCSGYSGVSGQSGISGFYMVGGGAGGGNGSLIGGGGGGGNGYVTSNWSNGGGHIGPIISNPLPESKIKLCNIISRMIEKVMGVVNDYRHFFK